MLVNETKIRNRRGLAHQIEDDVAHLPSSDPNPARLLGLSLEHLQLIDGWLGVCEHAGERRLHPRVSQVSANSTGGVEPGCVHPG